jgi:hypothetical protein
MLGARLQAAKKGCGMGDGSAGGSSEQRAAGSGSGQRAAGSGQRAAGSGSGQRQRRLQRPWRRLRWRLQCGGGGRGSCGCGGFCGPRGERREEASSAARIQQAQALPAERGPAAVRVRAGAAGAQAAGVQTSGSDSDSETVTVASWISQRPMREREARSVTRESTRLSRLCFRGSVLSGE